MRTFIVYEWYRQSRVYREISWKVLRAKFAKCVHDITIGTNEGGSVFTYFAIFRSFFCLQNSITCHVPFFLFSNDDRKFKIYDNKISCYSMKSYWFSRFESMLMMMIAKIRSLRLKFFILLLEISFPSQRAHCSWQ